MLFIPCIFIELNCSFTTQTTAPFTYTNPILHHSYMFRWHAILSEFYNKI